MCVISATHIRTSGAIVYTTYVWKHFPGRGTYINIIIVERDATPELSLSNKCFPNLKVRNTISASANCS